MTTLAKTPDVKRQMEERGVTDIVVAPCCLDLEAVHKDFEEETAELRSGISLSSDNKVILYLARLIDEKHPLEMLDIFEELHRKDPSYHMISIGTGELQGQFEQKIDELGLKDAVLRIESIPNSEVWKYYCMADVMVNLNRVEIFGMAILEAMYYGCPVVARRAPGPEYILTDDVDGYLCDNSEEIMARVNMLCDDKATRSRITAGAKSRIMKDFVWQSTAQIMLDVITEKQSKNKD
jgi:1,2-diacylglycerol 3-alpha-glucosyltransferase